MSDILPAILSPFFSSIATIFKAGAAKNLTPLIVVSVGGLIGSIILFLIARLFRERFSFDKIKSNWKDLISVLIVRNLLGELMAILAMGFFASSYAFGKRLAHNVGSTYSNAISMGIASILLLPFVFLFSPISVHASQSQGWLYLIIYVILFNVISLTLWYMSLKTVKGWIVSALRYIGPVLGVPVAYILFGERLNSTQVFGVIIIILTSFLIVREHFRSKKATDNL